MLEGLFRRKQGECREATEMGNGMAIAPSRTGPPVSSATPWRTAPPGTQWTCPMHPEIVRDEPGSCPICGMALEPMTPSADAEPSHELVGFTRRKATREGQPAQ